MEFVLLISAFYNAFTFAESEFGLFYFHDEHLLAPILIPIVLILYKVFP